MSLIQWYKLNEEKEFREQHTGDWYIDIKHKSFSFEFSGIPKSVHDFVYLRINQNDLEYAIDISINGNVFVNPINGTNATTENNIFQVPQQYISETKNIIRIYHDGGQDDWGHIYEVELYSEKKYIENQLDKTKYGYSTGLNYTTGRIDKQVSTTSTGQDYIIVPHNEQLSRGVFGTSTTFSFSQWVNISNWINYGSVINKMQGGSWSNTTQGIWTHAGGIRFIVGSNEGGNPSGSTQYIDHKPTLNEWHHIQCVQDKGKMYMFCDNQLVGTSNIGNITRNRSENTSQIVIQGPRIQGYTEGFPGKLEDLRIYDHQLPIEEINNLFKQKILDYKLNNYKENTENLLYNKLIQTDSIKDKYKGWEKIGISNDNPRTHLLTSTVQLKPNTKYSLSCIYWSSNQQIDDVYLKFNDSGWPESTYYIRPFVQAQQEQKNGYINNKVLQNNWFYLSGTFETQSTTNTLKELFFDVDTQNVTVFIQNIQLEEKDHQTPYTPSIRNDYIYDQSGYSNNQELTFNNYPVFKEENNSYYFDHSYIKIPNNNIFKMFDSDFTISANIMPYTLTTSNDQKCIFTKGGTSDTVQGFRMVLISDGRIWQTISNGTTRVTWYSNSSININEWCNITISYDRDGYGKIYINGILDSQIDISQTNGSIDENNDFYIGVYTDGVSREFIGEIKDIQIYKKQLTQEEIKQLVKTKQIIDNNGNLSVKDLFETKYTKNILDYTTWNIGSAGSQTGFSQNGSTQENQIIEQLDPFGEQAQIWEQIPDQTSGPDGGWNSSSFSIDNTKLYRFSVWVKRTGSTNGTTYHGCHGYGSTSGVLNSTDGQNNTNPYFWYGNPPLNEWVLIVGHVHPAGTQIGIEHPDSGIYNTSGQKIFNIQRDFIWRTETTSANQRTYLYYCTDTNVRQYFAYPRVDIIDDNQPSLQDLLNKFDIENKKYISKFNNNNINIELNKENITIGGQLNEIGVSKDLKLFYELKNNFLDYSGNKKHAINNGQIFKENSCYFDGQNNYIYNSEFNVGSDPIFTISMNVKRLQDISGGGFWGLGGGQSEQGINNYVSPNTTNKIGVDLWGQTTYDTGIDYPLKEWIHVVWIKNKTGFTIDQFDIYINGTLYNLTTIHRENSNIVSLTNGISFGRISKNTDSYYQNVLLKNIRVYNRQLDQNEIKKIYEIDSQKTNFEIYEKSILQKGIIKEL